MSKQRITIETLASGQPRPYADHRLHVKVTFEWLFAWNGNEKDPRSEWKPSVWTEPEVKVALKTLKCGFTDDTPVNWASPRLERLWKSSPGVWEFVITEAYTD